jgi:hypothetical protein
LRTLFYAVLVAATLLIPIILIVRHLAQDDEKKAQKLLRQEVENRQRMMRTIESDLQRLRESSFRIETKTFKDIPKKG